MKLDQVVLTNFRCFKNESIALDRYVALVGSNNCGKSTVLKAIDLFFRSNQKASPIALDDFNDVNAELKISLTFSDLSKKAEEEFGHYYRHGKLDFFIRAKADSGTVSASIHGQRLGMADFGEFHKADGAAEKKATYSKLQEKYPDLPELAPRSAVAIFSSALFEYEANHQDKCVQIESEDLAFGAAGIASKLKRYVDWVYIPAVKDASDEDEEAKNNAFGVLVNRIIRAKVKVDEKIEQIKKVAHTEIKNLVGDYKQEIKLLETVLDTEFRKITSTDAHVHLDWTEVNEDNVTLNLPLVRSILSDDTYRGDVSEFGHGLQRNYLMALVHLNAKLSLEEEPSIILACEEPELYQHPPQARYLHTALQKIAESDQVLITTHSPLFISAQTFENLRVVRKARKASSKVTAWSADQHRKLIAGALGIPPIGEQASAATLENFIQPETNEAFFCGKLVLVEGPEDRAILSMALKKNQSDGEFARLGGHIICANGKGGLVNMIAMSRGFDTPYFVVFDADTNCKKEDEKENRKRNSKISMLMELNIKDAEWPSGDIFNDRVIIWKDNIQASIANEYSAWYDDVKGLCTAFGWEYDRLKKNPVVLLSALEAAIAKKAKLDCLDHAAKQIMKFASA